MTVKELEQRVIALEEQVNRLTDQLASSAASRNKSWLAAVEKYAGDEDLLSIFAGAQKLREKDRQKARCRTSAQRKSRS
jgi:hypothetical protein